ncbi:DUF6185 family protein [Streptomyces sp. Qhu-G9]|uniref:DUF6185 family protein n=1 Tax=Streptomyces sp. Qhu-G9 TaxID=3452799 RepID=UPI0022AC7F2B|nr:DUF6185 family protein [Streptomyces aurantiacus]WAU82616.1 DUF6185 family protein [Streptomyces aurantiacus]
MTALFLLFGLVSPEIAQAAEPSAAHECESTELAKAKVTASVRLEHDDRTYTKVVSEFAVDVPETWPLAHDLLLSENSRRYISAMSCLSRGTQQGLDDEVDDERWSEWRAEHPSVTSQGGRVKVVYKAYGWVDNGFEIDVGVWRIAPVARDQWSVKLMVPAALHNALWEKVTVDPGRPGAQRAEPEPKTGDGATALVWRPGWMRQVRETGLVLQITGTPALAALPLFARDPAVAETPEELSVTVTTRPSWQRSWAAQGGQLPALALDLLGSMLWAGATSALLLTAYRRYRGRVGTPTNAQRRSLGNLRLWALATIPIYLLAQSDGVIEESVRQAGLFLFFDQQLAIRYGLALVCVVILLGFARPSSQIRWTAVVLSLLSLAAAVLMWTVVEPPTSYLISESHYGSLEMGLALQIAGSFCLVALLLLAIVAVAWRLATDGQLLPKSRRHPGLDRKLTVRTLLPTVLVVTVLMAVCFAVTEERNWQRATWLTDPVSPEYGADHRADFLWEAMWSVTYVDSWIIGYHGWLLTGVAVVAVLGTWRTFVSLSPLDDPADRLLFLAFFPLMIGLDVQNHLGIALLDSLWIPLYMLALYEMTALLAHRSVLAQPFEISQQPLATAVGPSARDKLLAKARSYREIHAELRRLDQGLFGDAPPERAALERKLEKLHDWDLISIPGAAPERLPTNVSVVDAALALGPRDDWWGNGVRGTRFALLPGSLAAALNTWAEWVRGEAWQNTLTDLIGLPGLTATLISWTATFAAAGFLLGALWRVLPGRRGASKAIPVAVAFAAPAALDGVIGWFTNEGATNLALQISTMLFVLTVTSIALDLDTFRGERRYWQSRFGLLLSIYQMRYYSLQVAYLIGQIIAIITIWQFFAEPDAVPSLSETPPDSP